MHRNVFFDGTNERLDESALWIFNCRNCGNSKDGIWRKRITQRQSIEWRNGCKDALDGMLYFYIPKMMRQQFHL